MERPTATGRPIAERENGAVAGAVLKLGRLAVNERHGFAVYAADVAPVPTRWGLILGDIANNYRSAIDHLAWALVSRGRTPPAVLTDDQRSAVQFPITQGRRQFNKSLKRRLPGAGR